MSETQQRENWEQAVQEAIRSLRFGSVVVVVHEGKVTQIEKREKIRPEDRVNGRANVSLQSPTHAGRPD
jgi:hypothetical protein